jgi:histidinol phosphatase-like enzyme
VGKALYVFDLDGTLAETWETGLLPGAADVVSRLEGSVAVATNQAGVGWNAVEGKPYPRPEEVGRRLVGVAGALPRLKDALWLVSIGDERVSLPPERWRALAAAVTRAAAPLNVRTSSDPAWRKPRPGMLLEACRAFDAPREETLFVGDRRSDAEAAEAAGVEFADADAFFGRD